MYLILKSILSKIVPQDLIHKNESFIRRIFAFLYIGNSHQCNICKIKIRTFVANQRGDLLCPSCGSLPRDRRLWQILESDFLREDDTILDFSPSRCLSKKMKSINHINYMPSDLSGNFNADFKYDITNLKIETNTVDLVICYHILEHIDNDLQAMSELYRILKNNGKAIIQTPFKEGEIYENKAITLPQEKLLHFGQEDHVRIYSVEGLKNRLINSGFTVEINNYPVLNNYNGLLQNETIFLVTKP